MAAETEALRTKARRVKDLALTEAEFVLSNKPKVKPEVYEQTYLTVLKNAVPRTQEITGEDGEKFTLHIAREVAVKNDINEPDTSTSDNSQGQD